MKDWNSYPQPSTMQAREVLRQEVASSRRRGWFWVLAICGVLLGALVALVVLYAAIGRRLGYPLKLVTTKAHLFLRWEDGKERFNLEATGRGMNRYDDEHFKRWPFPVSEEEIRTEG